jgi:hypothetical protein
MRAVIDSSGMCKPDLLAYTMTSSGHKAVISGSFPIKSSQQAVWSIYQPVSLAAKVRRSLIASGRGDADLHA